MNIIVNRTTLVLTAVIFALGLGACGGAPKNLAVDSAHNSRNSINWDGVYEGTVPAASGPGIKVQLTLNLDETYELQYEYIDRPGNFSEKGAFKWDAAGSVIILDTKDMPPYYKAGENKLIQLDMRGREITGSLAGSYVLRKMY